MLKRGDRVAVVAPSSPPVIEEVKAGLEVLASLGLRPVLGPNVKNVRGDGVHAGSRRQRADELAWAMVEADVTCTWTVQGGEGASGVLPLLDYGAMGERRRAFVGMSDNTAICSALLAKSELISVLGQGVAIRLDKGEEIRRLDSESLRRTAELLMYPDVWDERPWAGNPYFPRTVSGGSASGVVVGGNMDTFTRLIGTEYLPDVDGYVLFMEDVHKDGELVDRQLLHLELAGILADAAGFVVGEFAEQPKIEKAGAPSTDDVVYDFFSAGKPCTVQWPFSHGPTTAPIPIGAECRVDADAGTIQFDFRMG